MSETFTNLVKRVANLALNGVHREYPNQISHCLRSDADVLPPRRLTPAFYGCYDWHSAVHSHWLLVRLSHLYPDSDFCTAAHSALNCSLTEENLSQELRYISAPGRAAFERPYGLAWLLQLCAELREWQAGERVQEQERCQDARLWLQNLAPLEQHAAAVFCRWLPKLDYPLRIGTHAQTAFALALVLDWARTSEREDVQGLVCERSRDYYLEDANAALAFEPSGHDFLSPCLAEADLMRRVLPVDEFLPWLDGFLPMIPRYSTDVWLHPLQVSDPGDGHLVHLHGLNLSRAWMLQGIVSQLPEADPRSQVLANTARLHSEAGLASLINPTYAGGHWLGSFATYLITGRGLR